MTPTPRMLPLIALSVLALTLVAALASPVLASPRDDAQIARGQEVYTAQKCGMCHSVAGKGGKQSPLDGVGAKL